MARSENQKLKLLHLKELFETQSDEDHILSMQDIVSYLAARGIRAERKSVYADVACLQAFGMDIMLQKGPGGGYFLASRPFELAELKLLSGAVQASKFLSERKSVALIEKLSTLCSKYQAAQLKRQLTVRDRVKSMNESVYYTVDRIHEAIARNLQVRFRYFDWGVDGRKHERPGDYFASPYALVWDDENYYLIAHSERHGLTHYRVDKMAKLTISDKPRLMTEEAKNLDLTRYGKAVFGMFSGQAQQVKLRFQNSLAGVVLDRFGHRRNACAGRKRALHVHNRNRRLPRFLRLAGRLWRAGRNPLPRIRPGGICRPVPQNARALRINSDIFKRPVKQSRLYRARLFTLPSR